MAQSASKTGYGDLPKEFRTYATSAIAIVPVPFDGTSTWKKGADKGPAALLEASANMELFDIETESEVYRRGIHTLPAIKHKGDPAGLAPKVCKAVGKVFADGKFPVTLGGEHSISVGAFQAAAARWSDLSILQIDAHGDTRESFHGSKFNHACVMARARELCPITQVGIRAIDASEYPAMDKRRVFWGHDLHERTDDKWIDTVVNQQSKHVYVTIDLDAFDPSLVGGTGTTEPGGLNWRQVNELIRRVSARRTVVGFDVVELLPAPGQWASDMLAAKLVYRFLSEVFERGSERLRSKK
ncbi:MAG: agmatinase [Phycisphaerae bacterium]|jgi:agmatinase|nr:agmatinase [Phycisphaerae bacterium]